MELSLKEFKETIGRLKKSNSRLLQLQKSLRASKHVGKERTVTGRPLRRTLPLRSSV